MRKVFLFVLLLFLVAFGFFLSGSRKSVDKANLKQNNVQKQKEMTDLDPTPITNTFIFDGQQYEYAYKMVPSSSNIFLFPNFTTKYTSNEIIKNLNCIFGINGGFYQKDGTPLGLFYIDNKMLSVQIQSATFDGFIAKKNNSKNLIIGEIASDLGVVDSYEFIVQSGPYYDLRNESTKIFTDEEYARRSVIAQDQDDNTFFFTIFLNSNKYKGPRLSDVYNIFTKSELANISKFTKIINMDGGTASSFYDQKTDTSVRELTPIGSFLCGI